MPRAVVALEVAATVDRIWAAVLDFGLLAAAMPGYQGYQSLDERTSVWSLKSDIGIFERPVRFRVEITDQDPPRSLAFTMKAEGEPLSGTGRLEVAPVADGRTAVQFELNLSGSGLLAPVVNALLEKTLPRDVGLLAAGVKRRLEEEPR